ncbi:hypothetical protein L6164_013083 [Bauhinia variegata]|uniref:Uncharacterized protein n=1 Tax=Bauhinia variegata TaxID=167791 RepID=A0ACB9PB94_BAUVA|nr:hypothetical protein L6164_013083 [Bauhinia variegata]
MSHKKSSPSSSSIGQFRLVDLKLPTLDDQNIKTQVQKACGGNYSLVLRQPLLVSICHILKHATNFVDSVLLDKKEHADGVELETRNVLELNSTFSELDALVGDRCFSTRTLLEREHPSKRIMLQDRMLVKFSRISELKMLARDDYFMYPALQMDKTANNVVQRFDDINLHMATMDLVKSLSDLSWDAKAVNTMGCFVFKFLEFLGFLLHGPNQPITELASSMAALMESSVNLVGSPFEKFLVPLEQLNNLVKLTLEVIEYISEFTLLSNTEYSKEDLLPTCAYWAILSAIACYIQITFLMHNGEVALELSHLISNLSHILNDLKRHYTICKPQIDEMEAHLQQIALFEDAFSVKQLSNTQPKMSELMKSFMYTKDGCHAFIDGSTRSKVDLEVLNEKAVIFLISDLDIPDGKLTEAEHFPFKRMRIGGACFLSGPPTLKLLYHESREEDVNQKKPSSGFQGLVAMSRLRGTLNPKQAKFNPADASARPVDHPNSNRR